VLTPTKLEAEGWVLRQSVPGFRQVSSIKRPLEGVAGAEQGPALQVLQTIFSDGLTYVSVFIEPFNPDRHAQESQSIIGATQTLMRRQSEWWITVVGDVPTPTLRAFAAGLERKK
jgi:sigma-E factor negative regulatory protein RseB